MGLLIPDFPLILGARHGLSLPPASLELPAGEWTPADLSTLALWYDAEDSPFTEVSGVVSQWNDLAGNVNLAQSDAGQRPTRVAAELNGKAVMRFDGGDAIGAANPVEYGAIHWCAVAKKTGAVTSLEAIPITFGAGNAGRPMEGYRAGRYFSSGVVNALTNMETMTSWTILDDEVGHVNGVPQVTEWKNGTLVGSGSTGSFDTAGQVVNVAMRADGVTRFRGDVACVVATHHALSETDRQKLEGWAAHRYGLTANLPADHPHKTTPPTQAASPVIDPWSPLAIPTLQAWWDADHAASFTYSSGTLVSEWADRAGGGRHLRQATVAEQPSRSGTVNGRSSVVFDGSDDYLLSAAIGGIAPGRPFTILAVAKRSDSSRQRNLIMPFGGDGRIYGPSGDSNVSAFQGSAFSSGLKWGTTAAHAIVATFRGTTSKIATNGGAYTVGNAGTGAHFRDRWLVGSDAEEWAGDVCEIVTLYGELTAADLAAWWAYTSAKWGTH